MRQETTQTLDNHKILIKLAGRGKFELRPVRGELTCRIRQISPPWRMKVFFSLKKSASLFTFGAVFLFWEGFSFLVVYFQRFSISISLGDFTLQEVFLSGISPFLILLL